VYTHRSGRTGRAGKTGVSITITTQKFEDRIKQIERYTKASFKKMPIPSGEEVCQKQLFHIIKGIHHQEVQDSEIEPFLPQIYEELQDLTREDLIKRFASVEFNRFLSYYKSARDLNIYPKTFGRTDRFDRNAPPQYPRAIGTMPRLFINLGTMDGLSKKDFIGIIAKNFNVPSKAFGDIDMKKTHTYFDLEANHVDLLKNEIHSATFDGRPLRVNDATEKPREGKKFFDDDNDWKKKKKKRF
jgi:ATP-dependent RNA helicase DeaD